MDDPYAREDAEALMERLLRVENALFCLKAKVACFPSWDNSEVDRLEKLRAELRAHCERRLAMDDIIAS